jgi:hypothetical protein
MDKLIDISNFKSFSIPEKLNFLSNGFVESIKKLDERTLNALLRNIILDLDENSYVRKIVLELFTELVMLGKLKTRHAFSLLIDDWKTSDDIYLEIQRLKDLLLYYEEYDDESENIEFIFQTSVENSEAEIVGESLYNLGIVSLFKALRSSNEKEYISSLDESESYFHKSINQIENRVDSLFYQKIILILKELLSNKWGSSILYIKELGNNLFQKEVFSFKFDFDNLQYGFYKILISLKQICIQQPKNWIDYRLELDKVFLNFIEITNSRIATRLNEKSLLSKFGIHLKDRVLEPYFVINLSTELIKIDVLLRDIAKDSFEYSFLRYLKTLIERTDKKKVEWDRLELEFKKLFPYQNPHLITKIISEIKEPNDYLRAFELLSQKNNDNLINRLMFACSKLQGDKKYWGMDVNENDRNRFIATILESSGFTIKDQPQWSTSAEGKDSGEIDIFITESNGTPKSIIEALVLDSLKQNYLSQHLDKLFRYDTTGLENNFIISYSLAKSFNGLWNKYQDFISKHLYEYSFIDFKELVEFNFSDIRIGMAQHLRNGKVVNLYHILINLIER